MAQGHNRKKVYEKGKKKGNLQTFSVIHGIIKNGISPKLIITKYKCASVRRKLPVFYNTLVHNGLKFDKNRTI